MENISVAYLYYIVNLFGISFQLRDRNNLEEIMKIIKDNKFIKKICKDWNSDRIQWECCKVLQLEIYTKGEKIINFGEVADRFYIIIKGKVCVLKPTKGIKRIFSTKNDLLKGISIMNSMRADKTDEYDSSESKLIKDIIKNTKRDKSIIDFNYLAEFGEIEEFKEIKVLEAGDSFGELALIANKPRTATVESPEDTYLAVLSKKDFNKILLTHATESLEERVILLQGIPFFQNITKLTLQKLSYGFSEITYRKDQTVYDENSDVESIYFIKSGEFKILKENKIFSDKFKYSDTLLKLSFMKKLAKRKRFSEIIKGNMEIFGYEEIILNLINF